MKKFILIGLLLLTSACQTATPSPEPILPPTATVPASPTPIPATSTPEPTLTPEPTSTPLPRFFTQRFDASLAGWVTLQAGNPAVPNISAEDGSLRLQMDSPYTWLYTLYGAQDYADVYIETQFINSALSPASAGLVCRYSEEDGWLEYNVYTDGTYSVLYGRWLDTGIADYLPILDGTSREVGQSGVRQSIGLTCSGTALRLHINGTIVRNVDISRYELSQGRVGLTASSFENTPVVVVFESVTVGEP
jgi:hypothetical protein